MFDQFGGQRAIATFLSVELPRGTTIVTATPVRVPANASVGRDYRASPQCAAATPLSCGRPSDGDHICFEDLMLGMAPEAQSERHSPSPDTRRRPDHKSPQVEATPAENPESVDCSGFTFMAVNEPSEIIRGFCCAVTAV